MKSGEKRSEVDGKSRPDCVSSIRHLFAAQRRGGFASCCASLLSQMLALRCGKLTLNTRLLALQLAEVNHRKAVEAQRNAGRAYCFN